METTFVQHANLRTFDVKQHRLQSANYPNITKYNELKTVHEQP